MKYIVAFVLALSLTTNVLLINKLYFNEHKSSEQQVTIDNQERPADTSIVFENSDISNIQNQDAYPGASTQPTDDSDVNDIDVNDNVNNKEKFWDHLQKLRGNERHFELLVAVREFLRENPENLEAILLEAEAIYHTQPLNTAIVHYYGLRDLPFNKEQRLEIEKFIEIHSSKIIQQFSGDGHWHLLSAFLEPLMQIDPRNKNYIYALAQAYGMEEQFSLMEDTLAALPSNDRRANSIRERIYSEDKTSKQELVATAVEAEPSEDKRYDPRKTVYLRRTDNQLFAQAYLGTQRLRLLVDTGASVTALPKRFEASVKESGEYLGVFNVQTAGGMISSPMYKISNFWLGRTELTNVSVMLLEDSNLGDYQGLLGMNVLSKYNFNATPNRNVVALTLIE